MGAAIDPSALIDTILSAAVDASECGLAPELPLNDVTDRNEQWVQSYVGVHLNDLARRSHGASKGVYVIHEARVSWMDEMTSVGMRVGAEAHTSAQRFDLAVWNEKGVEGVIEIKNSPGIDANRFTADVRKLEQALARWGADCDGTLRWAAHLFSVRLTRAAALTASKRALEELFDDRLSKLKQAVPKSLTLSAFRRANRRQNCCLGWGVVLLT